MPACCVACYLGTYSQRCQAPQLLTPTPVAPPRPPQEQVAAHEAALEAYRVAAAGGMQQQQLVRWYLEALVERCGRHRLAAWLTALAG
jgi:hypothetical protein